jgi:pectin methylesterase-like acyl-CoA thioesterase
MPSGAGAVTIAVNASGNADYTKIQDVVNAANNGDTINVASGTYYENVFVNKSVNIVGSGEKLPPYKFLIRTVMYFMAG